LFIGLILFNACFSISIDHFFLFLFERCKESKSWSIFFQKILKNCSQYCKKEEFSFKNLTPQQAKKILTIFNK
jgi:hypothetical protein